MTKSAFASLALCPELLKALDAAGYETPTEIQEKALPIVIEGKDVLASAQTGTGKTAAFSLPMLHLLHNENLQKQEEASDGEDKKEKKKSSIKALILSPTRELAQQIEANIRIYSQHLPFKVVSLVGGLPINKQMDQLKKGTDIVVATPGRLLDLLNRKALRLDQVKYFVLDEADRMLDMGFVHDVQDIARVLPEDRQTLLFSATMTAQVTQLASVMLKKNPASISVNPDSSVAENIEEIAYYVDMKNKRPLLALLLADESVTRALVFTATKSGANVLATILSRQGIPTDAIHSDKNQNARQEALKAFATGEIRALIATDVMARGIDVDGITHVINFDLPNDPESYVHRIGRTARAGSSGKAISFCDHNEVGALKSIESFIEHKIEPDIEHQYHSPFVETMKNQRENTFGRRRR